MNRDEFHYAHTAALAAEATLARTGESGRAYLDGLAIARADAMVDWMTPAHLHAAWGLPLATQVRVQEGAAAQVAGGFWPCMERVARFHFTPPDDATMRSIVMAWRTDPAPLPANLIRLGVLLHAYQDCGEPGCPHRGYLGFPSPVNWRRSEELRVIEWYERAVAWVRPSLKERVWGHALDSAADDLERCRRGAVATSIRIFEGLSGQTLQWSGEGERTPHWLDQRTGVQHRCESVLAAMLARNDADLAARARRTFEVCTGKELPRFQPFVPTSEEWNAFLEATK